MSKIIALDVETTGLSVTKSHRVIELACCEVGYEHSNYFHRYLNPEREIDPGAYKVHGISNIFLRDKPKFKEIVDDFLSFVRGSEIVIHNAPFDLSFINYELKMSRANVDKLESICKITDSLRIARSKFPNSPNKLDDLALRYNINTQREKHGALVDAQILSKVFSNLTQRRNNYNRSKTSTDYNEYTILSCPNSHCRQLLRVPIGKRLRITCSRCGIVFERYS